MIYIWDQAWFWPAVMVAVLAFINWYMQLHIQRAFADKDKSLPYYQEALIYIDKLERSLDRIMDWHQIEPVVNNLRNYKIENYLYLDDGINMAIDGLVTEIAMQYAKEFTQTVSLPINLLTNEAVSRKISSAKDAILTAAGRKKQVLTHPKDELEVGKENLSLQIPILTSMSLLLFYILVVRLPNPSIWDTCFFGGLGILVLLFAVFLCLVVYLPVKFSIVAQFIAVTKTTVWKTAYIDCLITNYACILVLLLASIATKEAAKQIDIGWFYVFYFIGLAILLAVVVFPLPNLRKKNKLWQNK